MKWQGVLGRVLATLLAAAAAMAPAWAGDAPKVQRGRFTVPVLVKADGSIELGELEGAEGPVVAVIRRKLAALHYLPAVRDGVAVSTAALLYGKVILTPADGQYAVSVADVSMAPWMEKGAVPLYPVDRCRAGQSGTAEMAVRIGPEGQVLDAQVVSASHPDFAKAVQAVAKKWRFGALQPGEEWSEIAVPILFFAEGCKLQGTPFQCPADGRARVEGELRCLDRIEVYCWKRTSRIP